MRIRIDPATGSRDNLATNARLKVATLALLRPATSNEGPRRAMTAVRREPVMQNSTKLIAPCQQHPRSGRRENAGPPDHSEQQDARFCDCTPIASALFRHPVRRHILAILVQYQCHHFARCITVKAQLGIDVTQKEFIAGACVDGSGFLI